MVKPAVNSDGVATVGVAATLPLALEAVVDLASVLASAAVFLVGALKSFAANGSRLLVWWPVFSVLVPISAGPVLPLASLEVNAALAEERQPVAL